MSFQQLPASLPQSLSFLLIFPSLSILNLWRILRHWLPSPVLSPAYDPFALDLVAPPSFESPIGPELRHSTWVSISPPYLTDYHCYFALATLYESHTYREAHTDPLWQQTMNEELDTLHKDHTWDMVNLLPSQSVVCCR